MQKLKHSFKHENKVNENKVLSYSEVSRYMQNTTNHNEKPNAEQVFYCDLLCFAYIYMPNLQTHYRLKLDFQKVEQHTRGRWLIHGTKHHKDHQLQSLELPCRISK